MKVYLRYEVNEFFDGCIVLEGKVLNIGCDFYF